MVLLVGCFTVCLLCAPDKTGTETKAKQYYSWTLLSLNHATISGLEPETTRQDDWEFALILTIQVAIRQFLIE